MEKETKNEKVNNRDIDLMKIQVLDSNSNSWFALMSSILTGGVIGLLFLSVTLYYQKTFDDLAFYLSLATTFVVMLVGFYVISRSQKRHSDFLNDLFLKIEKGETLPSVTELKKLAQKKYST